MSSVDIGLIYLLGIVTGVSVFAVFRFVLDLLGE